MSLRLSLPTRPFRRRSHSGALGRHRARPGRAVAGPGRGHHARLLVTPITVQVTIGPDNDQPCTVSADIYKPDNASASRKAPAILTTNGFGGSKDDSNETAIGKGFVNQGYVVLAYSGLGFGTTTCKISLDDPQYDGKAGKQMVDVLAGTRAFTLDDGSGGTGSSTTSRRRRRATRGSA